MSHVIIFDTETTDNRDHPDREVIEAAWIALHGGQDDPDGLSVLSLHRGDSSRKLYKPSKPCSFGSLAVHHILPSDLEGCDPSSSFALPPGVQYLIGHSIDFDWESIGKPDVKRICTHAMSKAVWPTADSHSQSALLYMLEGVNAATRDQLRNAHSALTDCHNNYTLLRHILAAKPDITSWSALYAFSENARIPTHMPMGRNKGTPITQIESGEMEWYLDRRVGDPYMWKAFEAELDRRRSAFVSEDWD